MLRFYCCWEDTEPSPLTGRGQKLPFELHYYVADDSIEIVEVRRDNTGRDPFPLLLSRRQLPQEPNVPPIGEMKHQGSIGPWTNVPLTSGLLRLASVTPGPGALPSHVPPLAIGGRPLSPRSRSLLNIKYYNWRGLRIGSTVNVYGRNMLIYDCDAFTKQWYKV